METNNLEALIGEIEEQVNGQELDIFEELDVAEQDRPQLWRGERTAHLVDLAKVFDKKTKKHIGYRLVFADQENNVMPGQFGDDGGIWAGRTAVDVLNRLRSFKYALHMPMEISSAKQICAELQKPHLIYFTINSSMQDWGISYTNRVDFKKTSEL